MSSVNTEPKLPSMLDIKGPVRPQSKDEDRKHFHVDPSSSSTGASPKKATYRMTDKDREIIMQMTLRGKKATEIGEVLGIKANTVAKFLERKKRKAMSSIDPEVAQLLARTPSPKKVYEGAKREK